MKIISHRGNLNCKNNILENSPEYIDNALKCGFDVEIDIRLIDNELFLGHDYAQYKISKNWLFERNKNLWIHAKNFEVLNFLSNNDLNWFWHENDKLVLTSKNYIWCFPEIYIKNGITVELNYNKYLPNFILGICTDFPMFYR